MPKTLYLHLIVCSFEAIEIRYGVSTTTRTPGHFFTGRPRSGIDRSDSARSTNRFANLCGYASIIGGDECRDLLQIRQSCLGIDYRAVHAAIRARTSAAE